MATFSNGHTHRYTGKRPVTVAWMVVHPDGHIDSGHSLDRSKAEKTARSSAALARPTESYRHSALMSAKEKRAEREATADYLATCKFEFVAA